MRTDLVAFRLSSSPLYARDYKPRVARAVSLSVNRFSFHFVQQRELNERIRISVPVFSCCINIVSCIVDMDSWNLRGRISLNRTGDITWMIHIYYCIYFCMVITLESYAFTRELLWIEFCCNFLLDETRVSQNIVHWKFDTVIVHLYIYIVGYTLNFRLSIYIASVQNKRAWTRFTFESIRDGLLPCPRGSVLVPGIVMVEKNPRPRVRWTNIAERKCRTRTLKSITGGCSRRRWSTDK